jgi:hypothetical protein
VQTLLTRLETRTDAYKREINLALDRSVLNDTRSENAIVSYVTEFENATDNLRRNLDARRSTSADVEEVLNRAYYIDGFMRDYRFTPVAETQWRAIRTDLDTLSGFVQRQLAMESAVFAGESIRFENHRNLPFEPNQSDDVRSIVDRATANATINQRERQRTNLERRSVFARYAGD